MNGTIEWSASIRQRANELVKLGAPTWWSISEAIKEAAAYPPEKKEPSTLDDVEAINDRGD